MIEKIYLIMFEYAINHHYIMFINKYMDCAIYFMDRELYITDFAVCVTHTYGMN